MLQHFLRAYSSLRIPVTKSDSTARDNESAGATRRGATSWRVGFTLKTLSPRYLSDTAATAVSSLSIPLSTLIGIETENSLEQAARKNTFWRQSSPPALGTADLPAIAEWRLRRFDCLGRARVGCSDVEKRRPLRRQSDDHHFASLLMLAVTAGAFMLVAWSATKALLVFLQESPIP